MNPEEDPTSLAPEYERLGDVNEVKPAIWQLSTIWPLRDQI